MILFSTRNFDDYEIMRYELEDVLGDKADLVCGFIARRESHYGAIAGDGSVGYRITGLPLINDILSAESEGFELMNVDGNLQVTFYDHDGVHRCELVKIDEDFYFEATVDKIVSDLDKLELVKL